MPKETVMSTRGAGPLMPADLLCLVKSDVAVVRGNDKLRPKHSDEEVDGPATAMSASVDLVLKRIQTK